MALLFVFRFSFRPFFRPLLLRAFDGIKPGAMKNRIAIVAVAAFLVLCASRVSHAGMPEWVKGDFSLNGYMIVVMGGQHFSNAPITANPYEGPIGLWLPGATVPGAPPPAPGSTFVQAMIPKFELDVVKHFGKRARLRADLQFGRARSGTSFGAFQMDHAYMVVTLSQKYNVELWLGRIGLQPGYEPYQDYYNDTVSFSLLWRSIYPPAFVTGAQLSAVFSDHWSIYVGVGNGVITDNTALRKTLPSWVTSVIYSWGEEIRPSNMVFTGWWGPESGGNRPFSYGFDVTSTWYFAPRWLLGFEALWQRDNGDTGPTTDYAAALANVRWDFAKKWYAVLKYAYGRQFDAGNGVINMTGAKQQLHESTAALCYFIADTAKLKVEARVDVVVPAVGPTQYVGGGALALDYAF